MTESYDKNSAVVVLPPLQGGRLQDMSLRRWLAKADFDVAEAPQESLHRLLNVIGLPYPSEGLAALRMWGQTGDRPSQWIAAADPVYLEPQLDQLCIHALRRVGVAAADLRSLIEHLQATLGDNSDNGFVRLGSYGYVSAKQPFATAAVPAYVAHLDSPTAYLPDGAGSAAMRTLLSEIEMALHEHEVNIQRESDGLQPVNSLWLWGGGTAPIESTRPLPPLFSDDALMTGYWYASTGVTDAWPGDIASCIDASVKGFVAVTPEFDDRPELLTYCLHELREALHGGQLTGVTLLFRDGVTATLGKTHMRRFWRRRHSLLD